MIKNNNFKYSYIMLNIFFIYPNTLFKNIQKYIKNIDKIYIIEEPHFFTKYSFHKQNHPIYKEKLNVINLIILVLNNKNCSR